jgi:hypothetical protein
MPWFLQSGDISALFTTTSGATSTQGRFAMPEPVQTEYPLTQASYLAAFDDGTLAIDTYARSD